MGRCSLVIADPGTRLAAGRFALDRGLGLQVTSRLSVIGPIFCLQLTDSTAANLCTSRRGTGAVSCPRQAVNVSYVKGRVTNSHRGCRLSKLSDEWEMRGRKFFWKSEFCEHEKLSTGKRGRNVRLPYRAGSNNACKTSSVRTPTSVQDNRRDDP